MKLTWLVSVRLLDTTGRWCRLASCLGGELLTWGLATSGLSLKAVSDCSEGMLSCYGRDMTNAI